jgi:hypothetical protein
MVYGSHLFGTNVETSDRDFKSICLPSGEDVLLQQVKRVAHNGPSKERNQPEQEDIEFLSLQQYLKMLCEGQTVAVDMLFVPREYYVEGTLGPEWYAVFANRERFIHSNVDIFTGFAQSQARRYSVKAERLNAIEAAYGFFAAMEGLHGSSTKVAQVKMDLMGMACEHSQEVMSFPCIINPSRGGVGIEHFECCDRKVPLGATVKEAANIYQKASEFYGKRARLAQQMGGQDWKAMSHAVRIVCEAEELLVEGKITFPRPEAKLLLQIRKGELPHERVMFLIESGIKRVEIAKMVTDLPEQPDYDYADELVKSFYHSQVNNG